MGQDHPSQPEIGLQLSPDLFLSQRSGLQPSGTFIYNEVVSLLLAVMPEVIELPIELARFQLPEAVQLRLQALLDRQDVGNELSQAERAEAEGLVELSEFLSLLRLRSTRVTKQA